MNIKVNRSDSLKKAGKTSKSSASQAEGLGFASALSQAKAGNQVEDTGNVASVDVVNNFIHDTAGSQVPTESKERGYYILGLLEELEQDILAGKQTNVTARLEEALSAESVDKENLPPVVKDLMDEIDARAAIELEKLKT